MPKKLYFEGGRLICQIYTKGKTTKLSDKVFAKKSITCYAITLSGSLDTYGPFNYLSLTGKWVKAGLFYKILLK